MKSMSALLFVVLIVFFVSCGGGGSVGSSVSVDITTPSTTTDVDVSTQIVATVTDPDDIGITAPASWGDVFKLRAVGSDVNLCMSYEVTSPLTTITCIPDALELGAQYTVSISGLYDTQDNRIDPSSFAFQTATSPYSE